jgi:cyanophycin synthetase
MRRLTEFVDALMKPTNGNATDDRRAGARAIGVIGMPGDRRDEDHVEYGRLAGHSFDVVIVREDKNLRGRKSGESAALVMRGVEKAQKQGGRGQEAMTVLNELESAVAGWKAAQKGDTVVICADDTAAVYRRIMEESRANGGAAIADPGEFSVEEG